MRRQIGVIGSSEEDPEGKERAFRIGKEIARSGASLLTGGCTGLPFAAVKGAKEEGGFTIGISPAVDEDEHVNKYGYPVDGHDALIYTGFGYKGRNVILVRSCDAVVATSGRMGTLNEITIAYGLDKVIGLLKGVSGASEVFEDLTDEIGRPGRTLVSSDDPEELVREVQAALGE